MFHIAIVEDDAKDRELICSYLARYEKENGQSIKVTEFENAITFLTDYKPICDVVFIDIQMPHMNGMNADDMGNSYLMINPQGELQFNDSGEYKIYGNCLEEELNDIFNRIPNRII